MVRSGVVGSFHLRTSRRDAGATVHWPARRQRYDALAGETPALRCTGRRDAGATVGARSGLGCCLAERGGRVLRKLSLAGLRSLDLEFVEQERRTRDAEPDGFK